MASLDGAAFALEFSVSALALMLARRRPNHRPVAALFLSLSLLDVCRWFLHVGPLSQPGPYTGAHVFAAGSCSVRAVDVRATAQRDLVGGPGRIPRCLSFWVS